MLGDSITKSGSANSGEKVSDYTQSALNHLSEGRFEWSVVNEAVGKETAREALKRINRILDQENPELISIAYGLVDSNKKDPQWFEDNLYKLLMAISFRNPKTRIVLISTVPIDESIHVYGKDRFFKKYGGANRYINNEINSILRKVALKKKLPFIDLFRYLTPKHEWQDSIKGDGIHPDSPGNKLIGEYIGRAIFAYYSAHIAKDMPAIQAEADARQLLRKAFSLFISLGIKAAKECADLEEQAWNICPYLPENVNTFSLFVQIRSKVK